MTFRRYFHRSISVFTMNLYERGRWSCTSRRGAHRALPARRPLCVARCDPVSSPVLCRAVPCCAVSSAAFRGAARLAMSLLCRAVLRAGALGARRRPAAPGAAPAPLAAPARSYADRMMPDPIEHATGLEKKELLAMEAGNDDPFNIKAIKKGPGTKDCPTLVPSCFDARIVGCVCEEHATAITWLWLHKEHPRRCECGHWYKLIEKQPL